MATLKHVYWQGTPRHMCTCMPLSIAFLLKNTRNRPLFQVGTPYSEFHACKYALWPLPCMVKTKNHAWFLRRAWVMFYSDCKQLYTYTVYNLVIADIFGLYKLCARIGFYMETIIFDRIWWVFIINWTLKMSSLIKDVRTFFPIVFHSSFLYDMKIDVNRWTKPIYWFQMTDLLTLDRW